MGLISRVSSRTYRKKWETSLEESSALASSGTIEGSSDGPIWTTKKLTWALRLKRTRSVVARTLKASWSRKSESKPNNLTRPSESAFEFSNQKRQENHRFRAK